MRARIVVKPPGPKSKEMLAEQSSLETQAVYYSKAFPFAIDSAKGATIRDVDGNGIEVATGGSSNEKLFDVFQLSRSQDRQLRIQAKSFPRIRGQNLRRLVRQMRPDCNLLGEDRK